MGRLLRSSVSYAFQAFVIVLAGHALYVRQVSAAPTSGWDDAGLTDNGWLGLGAYLGGKEYLMGLSYALGAAYGVWSIGVMIRARQAAATAGAAGSITLVGVVMALGCFLSGCCGSPMLGVYASMFGAKALGVGKPIMLGVTVLSVLGGWLYMRRKCPSPCCGAER
ncbi:MAG: hypothetical protein HZC36_05485 [Armatimonadetes bacterium]|nr:hypothetical protein [Armatimonadota bacterium]